MELGVSVYTLMPMFIGERPAKGILLVAISHRMTAKLYMSAALLSMSSGRCWRAAQRGILIRTHHCTTVESTYSLYRGYVSKKESVMLTFTGVLLLENSNNYHSLVCSH